MLEILKIQRLIARDVLQIGSGPCEAHLCKEMNSMTSTSCTRKLTTKPTDARLRRSEAAKWLRTMKKTEAENAVFVSLMISSFLHTGLLFPDGGYLVLRRRRDGKISSAYRYPKSYYSYEGHSPDMTTESPFSEDSA